MKSRILVMLLTALMLLLVVSVASAHGLDSDRLENAGWSCVVAGDHGWVHCFPPGAPNGEATTVMVFDCIDEGTEPCAPVDGIPGPFTGTGHPFLGTELLISADVYDGNQLCVTDNGEAYHEVELPFGNYFACHHFDTSAE